MVETCSISTDTKMMTELSSILYSYQNEFLQGKLSDGIENKHTVELLILASLIFQKFGD